MSLERVIKALISLGLTRSEAEVYVYIAKKGPQKVVNIAEVLNSTTKTVYSKLESLETKGLIKKDQEIFYAIPFEDALDTLIRKKKERAQAMHKNKEKNLTIWKTEDQ